VALGGVLDSAALSEGLRDLVVQLDPIGDDDDGPVAGHGAQDLLGVEDHREALAGALGLPEDAGASVILGGRSRPSPVPRVVLRTVRPRSAGR
jgi:hypothetical protein